MPLLLSDLSFSYSDRLPLLQGVNLHLEPGWTGVVGPNGAGKTTLLRLLAGELRPTAGGLSVPGPVHRCPQTVDAPDDVVRDFAWGWLDGAWELQARLGLDAEQLDRWEQLSAGERKRWQVGAALASRPATLLLDEPTNHLDAATRQQLLDALGTFDGYGLVVSHDRALLDALCTNIVRVDGDVRITRGNYAAAEASRRQKRDADIAAHANANATLRRARARLADTRRGRDMATANNRTSRRMKNRRDSEARSTAAKARAAAGEARASHAVTLARRAVDRAEAARGRVDYPVELGRSLLAGYERPRRRVLLEHQGPVTAGERILFEADVQVERDARIWLRGPNGAGKSTLVQTLLAQAGLPSDKVTVLAQVLPEAERIELVAALRATSNAERGRTSQVLAALGVDPVRVFATDRPSPGEARKLAIANALARRVWLLVLDEPSNHLDLPSVERLQQALAAFPGALLLVTHDPDLAEATTRTTWTVTGGQLQVE